MVTAATSLAGTEVWRVRVWGLGARLGAGKGAFESWHTQEQNARSGASRRALERGGRRQRRRGCSGSMAKGARRLGNGRAIARANQGLTVSRAEVEACSGKLGVGRN